MDYERSERVLILQGGGSLGAYECGVYKSLAKHDIKFDIIAGTSIGAVNACIIAASKGDPVDTLQRFWNDIASRVDDNYNNYYSLTPIIPLLGLNADTLRLVYNALYGNRLFIPRWFTISMDNLSPHSWTYIYDNEPLKYLLQDYVDLTLLKSNDRPRLIVTATDILEGKPVVFDSHSINIDVEHILASTSFPFYGIRWVRKDGRYLWDGSLLSNTPLREVIDASPKRDKIVYMVNLFPRRVKQLPKDMLSVVHRARDILYSEKVEHNIRLSKVISRYLRLLKEMHDVLMYIYDNIQVDESIRDRIRSIESEYHRLSVERGAIIRQVVRIERKEKGYDNGLFEDADFSYKHIRMLIEQGERDADDVLKRLSNIK
jgi:NTE family protein